MQFSSCGSVLAASSTGKCADVRTFEANLFFNDGVLKNSSYRSFESETLLK